MFEDMFLFKMSSKGTSLTLWGGGHEGPHHNFVIAPMIIKLGTGIKLDVFYTMVEKNL